MIHRQQQRLNRVEPSVMGRCAEEEDRGRSIVCDSMAWHENQGVAGVGKPHTISTQRDQSGALPVMQEHELYSMIVSTVWKLKSCAV